MLGNVGFGELLAIVVIGLLVFGPERLPQLARDAGKALRELRRMATGARAELQDQLGPEFADLDLSSMDPRHLMEQAMLGEDEPESGPAEKASRSAASRNRTVGPLAPGEGAPFDPDAT